ncbi:MAG TPA: SpvB/TcaC N-terminal domain-containing protein [Verrucomicrobiae bacterium]|nr:SpvB/TcaC N-terminal domain-containing protein [Verrucomicrobiae bacterium]
MKEQASNPEKSASMFNTQGGKTESRAIETPSIKLPQGGGAIKGIDEKFSVNAVNGTAAFSVPLPVSPARGVTPDLKLSYNSGGGNGVFGLGWDLGLPSIKRKTSQELPQYLDVADSDTFLFAGAEDLVPEFQKDQSGDFSQGPDGTYSIREQNSSDGNFTVRFYRPRTEGLFARIERWTHKTTGETRWRVTTKDNVTTLLGWSENSRIADPTDARKVYEWLPEFTFDDHGNCSQSFYKPEDDTGFEGTLPHNANRRKGGNLTYTNRYLESIRYGNKQPYKNFGDPFPAASAYMFQTILDYGEYDTTAPYQKVHDWGYRPDAFSDHKPGFEVRTTRLCQRVLLVHYFSELPGGSALVRSLDFQYDLATEQGFTFLAAISNHGYIKQLDGTYTQKQLPPLEFTYQEHTWSQEVKTVAAQDVVNAPVGLSSPYTFTDLYGEGLSGILTEQVEAWYYKRNLGGGMFERAKAVSPKPAVTGLGQTLQLVDLDADGGKQLVSLSEQPKGYYELDDDHGWQTFKPFRQLPNRDLKDQNTRMIDLTGDGKPDLLITEDEVFTWYESEGRRGYAPARKSPKSFDEEKGPTVVFADSKQMIFLADMDGDGLTDIVRIRASEVCYWSNLGYGKFGAKIAMDKPPVFDAPDAFNPTYIQLADIDGSGTTDIVYLGQNKVTCWLNLSGNSFVTSAFEIHSFPEIHDLADVTVTDLLGTGTMCLVWSSPLTKDAHGPLRYIDLMNSKKPHIMIGYQNNVGKEVSLEYAPSTAFYLEDEQAGRPWITKLHFPVQCLSRTETLDRITGHRFVSSYKYHHGYYDHPEREFRGFGMVEQTDAEDFDHWVKGDSSNVVEQDLHQEPVVKKSWFHTGAFLRQDKILAQFANDYWYEEMARQGFVVTHNEHELPDAQLVAAPGIDPTLLDHLGGEQWQQALRACKGMALRSEVFAHDAPLIGATPQQLQTQLTPYSVNSSNCAIELLQPKGQNKYAVFVVKASESITYSYERIVADPRIAHTLTTKLDEYGNILESASVVYARQLADPTLPAETLAAQARSSISYKQNLFTNDVTSANNYRLRLPSEEKNFELRGIAKTGDYYVLADFENILTNATDVPYHQKDNNPPAGTPQKRLIEHSRMTYYKDNLSGASPLHQLESRGLPFESFQLAYTPELLTDIFGTKATGTHMLQGKFTHSEGDANWWVRSGTAQYITAGESVTDAANRFFMPVRYTSPVGAVTKVTYLGNFCMFIESTEDALGNKTSTDKFNFRTLVPERMRDINDNISEALSDELGLVKVMAILGKGTEADDLTGQDEFTTAAESAKIAAFFAAASSADLTAKGKDLLGHASIRVVYDFDVYQTSGKPVVAASIVREQHFTDNPNSPVQISFEYSGGLGQVVMKKAQAEPGKAKQLTLNPDDTYTVIEVDTTPQLRWVGTGRTVVNNKGNPVKQYQPFFSTTHKYEDNKALVETGVTSLFYYDAVGREVKMELPDGTLSKTEFTSWLQRLYDQGDTANDSSWHDNRVNSLINAQLIAEGKDPLKEKLAALASEDYHNTPSVQHFDGLGRPILQVQHNRVNGLDEFYYSHATLDIEGNLRAVVDARHNKVITYSYDLLGRGVYQDSMDNGKRWLLTNVVGEALRTWDERDHEFQYDYDILGRPTGTRVIGGDRPTPLNNISDRIFYGEGEANAKAKNLRGQVTRYFDTAGVVEAVKYDFMGQPLVNQRRLFADYTSVPNWTDANLATGLEPEIFESKMVYNALGRVVETTAPDGSIERTTFNAATLVEAKTVTRDALTETIIENIDYNEKGQRTAMLLGNGITTSYRYDSRTFALIHVTSRTAANKVLQDLHFTFDATGNVTHIQDDAIPLQFFNNQMITGLTTYKYDAIYQLTEATGRENNAGLAFGPEDNWNDQSYSHQQAAGDPALTRNYVQQYLYDSVGNIMSLIHKASGNDWTRDYTYQATTNRLQSTKIGAQTYAYQHHAKHGFITEMPHLEELGWNFKEKLVRTIRQKAGSGTPETTYYQYGSDGERLRKITENAAPAGETPGKKEERIYLGTYERYQKHSGEHAGLVRHSLSIVDETGRIALMETRNEIDDDTEPRLLRYQLANHLGSVNLEVDENAQTISYEEYHPFGTTAYQVTNKAVRAAAKRYRYVGRERDQETGLEYHAARYYICWLGRWLSTDPSSIDDGLNLYKYAKNNPSSLRDTNGNESDEQKASRMFADFLTEQGVNFKKEVPFRVEVNGKWVEGRADFFVEKNPGVWEPVEMKGKANSRWTKAQKEYLPALQSGAKYETLGTSKFGKTVTGSGGGKVFNVHTVAQGKFDFQKLHVTEVINRTKGHKQTITTDNQGTVVKSEKTPVDTSGGTRTQPTKLPDADVKAPHVTEPHVKTPHVKSPHVKTPKVRGKGLLGALLVAGGILLFTGDAKAAGQSLNPAADTTEAVIEGGGPLEVAGGVALDVASLYPPIAIIRTGVALNRAAMDASHFATPPGWVEQKVKEGRNPFCALCHGDDSLRAQYDREKEFKFDKSLFGETTDADRKALIDFINSSEPNNK